ncbi:MAG: hypothetical protein FWH24_00345 [Oscillospiraceae bacterium]|nr:hypothetical protein [Oscillospiraceae bacterium]
MDIGEKTAYLKGLAEGVELSSDKKEGKLLKGILDVLEDVAKELKDLKEEQENLAAYSEELDEDLGALEKAFITNRKRIASHFEDFDNFDNFDGFDEFEDFEDFEDEEDFGDLDGAVEINCLKCGELILFDIDDIIEEGGFIDCPKCGAEISAVGGFSSESGGKCEGCCNQRYTDTTDESK